MSHTANRIVHDADSHLIESRGWLESYTPGDIAAQFLPRVISLDLPILDPLIAQAEDRLAGKNPDYPAAM